MITDADVERWLREDVGHHDVTNDVPGATEGRLVATESGVAAGLDAAVAVFEYLGVDVVDRVEDGASVDAGDVVLRTAGSARATLRAERVAVNVAGHASGVATKTARAVRAARSVSDDVAVAATRKTTPGLRGVEKRAVAAGGGDTHRLDLSHMVMVKDNHVAEMGVEDAVAHFRERASFATKVEVEAETREEAVRAAAAGADVVLLDNMPPEETATVAAAVRAVADGDGDGGDSHGDGGDGGEGTADVDDVVEGDADTGIGARASSVLVEASGGITVEDVPAYAEAGVDVISMGGLTHSAPSLDYSFRTGD